MTLLELLLKINPKFKDFTTQEIKDKNGVLLGVKCFGEETDGVVFSGGTATSADLALRIAVAESFERSFLNVIYRNPILFNEFNMANFPSSSGFAAGFDEASTRFRALCEGLERWVWSKWIDEGYILPSIEESTLSFNPLTKHFLQSFEQTLWFQKDFTVQVSPSETHELTILVFLGLSGNGIFPGSRVSTKKDNLTQHPVIEAHRNLTNAQLHTSENKLEDIIQERTIYFAHHKEEAFRQIQKADKDTWPSPEISLLKKYETGNKEIFLYRSLMKDFVGWHVGDVKRFVY